jgi:uncharacterized protein
VRIAVIGAGISGLAAAWLLSRRHAVTLFEGEDYLGGHTHTHHLEVEGTVHALDTGFLVHNPAHYPLLTRLFSELGVDSQDTTMSFSVHHEASGREYNAGTLRGLFCQRRNLVAPRFLGMMLDLLRFYREAPALLESADDRQTLGAYLEQGGYGARFRDEHLVPMASALWSAPERSVLEFPVRYLVQFMANHQMLQLSGRPTWRVVRGGSARYVSAMRERWPVEERLSCPAHWVRRTARGGEVFSRAGRECFDALVLACHSDQALALLADASERERELLGAIGYQENEAVLHTDAALLPRKRQAWAAWNAWVPRLPTAGCTVSYCLNVLQGIKAQVPLVVTLNRTAAIDPRRILRRMRYAHPVYTRAAVAAQRRKGEIQGRNHTWFAGAYWGWGFHEDGLRSAVEVANALGVAWPETARASSGADDAPVEIAA